MGIVNILLPYKIERLILAMNRSASKDMKQMPWTLAGVWHLFLPFEADLFMDYGEWISHCHLWQIKLRDCVFAMNRSASNGMKQVPCTLSGVWHLFLPFEAELFMDSGEWISHCHLCQIKLRYWVVAMNRSTSKGMKHMSCTLAGVLWHVLLPFEAKVFMDS